MIFTFDIYRQKDRWFFDDDSRNIHYEEFVSGIPEIILAVAKNPEATRVKLEVHTSPIQSADGVLDRISDSNVNEPGVYYSMGTLRGWFCPTFWKYFDEAPATLWIRIIKVTV